jgi:hypothetical protein
MFSILIFSYFLLIRWDPPSNNISLDDSYNDSERSLVEPSSDFEETTPFNEDLSYVEPLTEICSLENIETLTTPYWSLDINLKKGEIVKATLENYPTEINSSEKKVLFNKCGAEKYSQLSGFEFLNKELNSKENLFYVKEKYNSNNKTFVVLEKKKKI